MNNYTLSFGVGSSVDIPLTLSCPYDFDYIRKFISHNLESLTPSMSNEFSKEDIPYLHLCHENYNIGYLALKETIKTMYADGNKPMHLCAEFKKYGFESALTYTDTSSGFCMKDVPLFEDVLKAKFLLQEVNVSFRLVNDFFDPPRLMITVEGFKYPDELQDIFEEELDFFKSTIRHDDYEWTIVTTIQSLNMYDRFLVFPEPFTMHTNEPFVIMRYIQHEYLESFNISDVHIAFDRSIIYVDVTINKSCSIDYCMEMSDTVMYSISRNLYLPTVIPNVKFEEITSSLKDKEPISVCAKIDSLFWLRMDTFFVNAEDVHRMRIKINEKMKTMGIDMEMTYSARTGTRGEIGKCNLSKFRKVEKEITNLIDTIDKEDSSNTEEEYTEVTIYPTYVSWFDNTHPEYPPEKCAIKVPCKYDKDEEDALISFIHDEFPSSEIMDANQDKMFSGMSGNYTFSVVDNEFCLSIAIKGGYMISHQLLKESFEKHMKIYISLYNMKKLIITECPKLAYDFSEDYVAGEKVINSVIVLRDDEYHVFIDFKSSDRAKSYMRDACGLIRRNTKKEVFLHEVPLFIIKDIDEHSTIKTETIDIQINGENKNDCTI